MKSRDTSLILITHDLGVVATSCDDVAVVYAGEIIEYGSKKTFTTTPVIRIPSAFSAAIPNLESDARRHCQH